jgi:hypothetical protein
MEKQVLGLCSDKEGRLEADAKVASSLYHRALGYKAAPSSSVKAKSSGLH